MTTTGSHLALLAAAALLGGCGLTLPWDSTPPIDVTVEILPAALTFSSHLGGGSPPPQAVVVRVSPAWVGRMVVQDASTLGRFQVVETTEQPDGGLRVLVQGADPDFTGEGTFAGVLLVHTCVPPSCAEAPGGPWTIPLTYQVGPFPISASHTALHFEQVAGGSAAAPQAVTLSGPPEGGGWTTELDFQGQDPWFTVTPSSGAAVPAELQVEVAPPTAVPSGLRAGNLRILRDGVAVDVAISRSETAPALTCATAELFFTAVQGQPTMPPAQDVVLGTTTGAETAYTVLPMQGWWLLLQTGTAPGTSPVTVRFTDLAPGRYEDVLTFLPMATFPTPGGVEVPVHYDVLPRALTVAPAALRVDVGGDTTPAGLSSTVTVSAPAGLAWTVEAAEPWLSVAPAGGTGPGAFTIALPPAALASRPAGPWSGRAVVRFTDPNAGPLATEVPFDVFVNLPWLRTLQPRIASAGSAAAFHVRPLGAMSALEVLFDGVAGAATPPALDGTVLVTPPPLAPGRWPVTVRNGLGIAWQPVFVDVVAPTSRAGASAPSVGRKGSIAFDDAAGRLFIANPGAGRVERYDEVAGWARTERAVAGLADAVLSPDGRELIAITADGARRLDAAALDGPLVAIPGGFGTFERTLPWRLALAADGRGLVVTPERGACLASPYDCGLHELDAGTGSGAFWLSWVAELADGWSPAMPEDRSAIWLLRHGALAPEAPRRWRPLGYGLDQPSPVVFDGTALDLDRHGTRALLLDVDPLFVATEGRLADLATGLLPGTLPPTTAAALLSQDGTRAVTFDGLTRTVRTFDLAAPPDPGTGRFVELGTPGGFAPPADPGAAPALALSIDERTLFLAGDDAVVICPLP